MKGVVLDYSDETCSGLISAEDGKRYTFAGLDWRPDSHPGIGVHVDFEADGERALEIYVDPRSATSAEKNRIAAALLAFFFGWLGIHKFYLGMNKPATIMICVSLGGLILLGIPTLIMMIIGFIEFIIYVTQSDENFEKIYVVGQKEWF